MSAALRILQVHHRYRSGWGGEDSVAELEADLLRRHGHEVEQLIVSAAGLENPGALGLIATGLGTVWSRRGYGLVRAAISRFSPDIMHVHNSFPLLSPSIYWAAAKAGVPVVQTLHNFRLTCANSLLLRNGQPCQDCVGHLPWAALRHRCFRKSFWSTAAVASSNVVHRWLGTYTDKVPTYIALTSFSQSVMSRSGLPAGRIWVKPNFAADPGNSHAQRSLQFMYVGEISRHKGVHLLLQAWKNAQPEGWRLLLVGEGPDREQLQASCGADSSIVWLGRLPHPEVIALLAASRMLVLPSLCYENFPMVLLEAFSAATPVIAPSHGAFPALLSDGEDGMLFAPGSAPSLAAALQAAVCAVDSHDGTWQHWSETARRTYLAEFTPARNYMELFAIYQETIQYFHGRQRHPEHRPAAVLEPLP